MDNAFHIFSLHRWRQVAAALFVGVLCVQVAPLQVLQQKPPAAHHHEYAERGFCPRNPGGPCTCDHHAPTADHAHTQAASEQTPSLRACGTAADAPQLLASGLVKGVFAAVASTFVPARPDSWIGALDLLTPQRRAVDIFRPPKSHLG